MSTEEKNSNKEIAELLRKVSAAYVLKGEKENRFRIIAYEKAADAVEHLSRELRDVWQDGKLYKVPGIGPGIGSSLEEYFKTGESRHFNEILKGIPESVFTLMKVPGIGPKRAFRLVMEFGLTEKETVVDDLLNVGRANKISSLEGFGQKSQDDIIEGLEVYQKRDRLVERMPLPYALDLSEEVIKYLKEMTKVKRADALGSLRRRVATIGDVDIAVVADDRDSKEIVAHFLKYPGLRSVEGAGDAKASILAAGNIRIDLRVQNQKSYGSMLEYFTGSKEHNIRLREYALKKGYSLSEYGIKKVKNVIPAQAGIQKKNGSPTVPDGRQVRVGDDKQIIEFKDEESLYSFLGLQYIPPEIREGTNEIDFAKVNQIPHPVELENIKGDFHTHSSYDLQPSHDMGLNSYSELVEKAKSLKYEYIGFSDHNPKKSNLSDEEIVTIMKKRKEYIDKTLSSSDIHYFIGLEVDILPSGELALPEKAFDYVDYLIVSLHSSFTMNNAEMTNRVLKALSYPKVKIFGHPTARLLGKREGVELDWDKIFSFAKDRHIALEINSAPPRLDLPDTLVREAKEAGVKFIINTDAHKVDHMDFMQYGVSVARRGWLTKNEVINTKPFKEIKNWLNKT
ncbi:hypothetical protein A3A93_03705 [Candidatus Roizmanbacteria bacterium RIFCSPLOWO2_01_FULL_38_12]|uniref:DNA polymerase beta n=1 Tax=Candidatus Roizmanbacteria bacterium RIFCSPLOWO2_01_FULL_38_12 TaxID=1802061 RepID=A0A1F7IYV5_9BACT|nr:MAG: hypothetical protein A2861_02865 [Candidatus Roizmanbacteria bacterium RIFCSPHIGHO2_01_FULL_38_15]OGK34406.1 MAG: hypothetical protein A3F59_02290 [Candidatus Roizmanbacteria bacterium RIFCSPHIGHO2_12_FULL_38_13]OGK48539.1 MAG: hypothetical protein A3A93_03705 [Candidatus Roizmanbacteria bacterium RIFCSPLOWO2_01_FULL_38_12]